MRNKKYFGVILGVCSFLLLSSGCLPFVKMVSQSGNQAAEKEAAKAKEESVADSKKAVITDGGNDLTVSDKSFMEIAALLKELGFQDISEEMVVQMEEQWQDYPKEVQESQNKVLYLLNSMGAGSYDFDTGEWTAVSNQVYWFDMEVFDVDRMYTLFLEGIQAISGGEFEITDIKEDGLNDEGELENDKKNVSFLFNQKEYTFGAEFYYDWFDPQILAFMNKIAAEQKLSKQFIYLSDGGQGCIVLYNTKEWAELFQQMTGIEVSYE